MHIFCYFSWSSGGLGGGLLTQPSLSIKQEQENSNLTHPLYRHGLCKWPGCDTPSEDFPSFIKYVLFSFIKLFFLIISISLLSSLIFIVLIHVIFIVQAADKL